MEVSHKFFVHDKFKEKGNKCMFKKKYSEAIKYYERVDNYDIDFKII
jgi:hypothetical protein